MWMRIAEYNYCKYLYSVLKTPLPSYASLFPPPLSCFADLHGRWFCSFDFVRPSWLRDRLRTIAVHSYLSLITHDLSVSMGTLRIEACVTLCYPTSSIPAAEYPSTRLPSPTPYRSLPFSFLSLFPSPMIHITPNSFLRQTQRSLHPSCTLRSGTPSPLHFVRSSTPWNLLFFLPSPTTRHRGSVSESG